MPRIAIGSSVARARTDASHGGAAGGRLCQAGGRRAWPRSGSRRRPSRRAQARSGCERRLRSSTAARESKPRSLKGRSGSIASAEPWPSTAATSALDQLQAERLALCLRARQRALLAKSPAAAARRGADTRTSPPSSGCSTPAFAWALSPAGTRRKARACPSPRPGRRRRARVPSLIGERADPRALHPRQVRLGEARGHARSRSPKGPRRSRWRAVLAPASAAARESQKALAAA